MKTRISILALMIAAISFNGASAQRNRLISPMITPGGRPTAADSRLAPAGHTTTRPGTSTPTTEPDNTAVIAEIKTRYGQSYNSAMNFCTRLPAQVNGAKVAAGVSLGTSIVGTLAGGAALTTGIMKMGKDKEIGELYDSMEEHRSMAAGGLPVNTTPAEADAYVAAAEKFISMSQAERDGLKEANDLIKIAYGMKIMYERDMEKMQELSQKSATLGTVRTVGNFVAGGAGAASAISAFVGAGQFDALIKDMNACDSHVRDIRGQREELAAVAPADVALAQMDDIIDACAGLNSKNIADVKNKLVATGIISSISGAAGLVGGVTSAIAGAKENKGAIGSRDTKGLNMASTVLAGVTTGTALTSTVISGVMLSDLMKNGKVAEACASAF